MRLLFISKYAAGLESSKPTRQYFFSKHLAAQGVEVKLIFSRSNGSNDVPNFTGLFNSQTDDNLETVILNGPRINFGFNLLRLWSWILFEVNNFRYYPKIKKWKPDVVLISSLSILTFLFGVFLKKSLKIPLILEVRDIYPLTLIEVGGLNKYNPFVIILRLIEKYGYKNADLIISSLENTERYFDEVAGKKINFLWLPMGFDNNLYNSDLNKSARDIQNEIIKLKGSGKFIVGYAGTIGTANALDELMKISQSKDIIDNKIHFVFIGDGPLKHLCSKEYSNNAITFYHSIEKKYIPEVLGQCDVLINTWLNKPIYDYGISPNKWIEYMYAERPIILALNSDSKIFSEANCGWKVPSQDSEALLNVILKVKDISPDELNTCGKNGKRYLFENLSYEVLTYKLYLEISKLIK